MKPDDALGDWVAHLRRIHALNVHLNILPLMTKEEAQAQIDSRHEMVRKETISKLCRTLITGSQARGKNRKKNSFFFCKKTFVFQCFMRRIRLTRMWCFAILW
jgi:hypothetical protein